MNAMTLPNLITLVRLILVPFVVVSVLDGKWLEATAAFALAGLSDLTDGFVARRFNMRSRLGAVLDPAADKVLLVSTYAVLAYVGTVPWWLAALVIGRDIALVVMIGVAWAWGARFEFRPLMISKINTAAQIIFAFGTVVIHAAGFEESGLIRAGAVITAALTILSAAAYLHRWVVSGRFGGSVDREGAR